MWLSRITLKDFRCFFGEHSIEFSQDPERNVTLIHAENGVGKTTLLNALLWCFYGQTTERFEKRDDLVNYDARAAGAQHAFVEVLFEHNASRYRARRFTKGGGGDREFTIMRIDGGSHVTLPNADAFINTVIPKSMAGHFLFDGEHAEFFLGEDNRRAVRRAVQDILGCSLIETAIGDLEETATWYRRQMPNTKASSSMDALSARIDALAGQITAAHVAKDGLLGEIEAIDQRIADIDDKLRNSAAAKTLQARRDKAKDELKRARARESDAQTEVLKWLGDNGRFLVSTKITELAMDHLDQQETKGRLPSPYNEEFVHDILDLKRCICGADLEPGTDAHAAVSSLLHKAANATLRSRIGKVKARLSQLKSERQKAPARLDAANKRLNEAREDISRHEQELDDVSESLKGIDFDDIAERETKRNELRQEANLKRQQLGGFDHRISAAEQEKASAERELKKLADEDAGSRVFMTRYALCERLKGQLELDLKREEEEARGVLRASINRILADTSRKAFKLSMSNDYAISLVNHAGTQMPKSSGENQLLGLAFTAALVEFARVRENASDRRLLKGTVAPLVLDSPFGQLDEEYRRTTASFIPQMAGQVVLMLSKSQASGPVMEALGDRIGEEVVLVRHNRADRDGRKVEVRQFHGKDVETAVFGAPHDGSAFVRVTR
ncbi:AAA family ATPase [Brevundimonas fluminis]|uniref:AAA family ATPase n=1 Tax=Brevundimonas fluminis TaxID=2487274 RepID=UPI000F6573DB|nr:AAA family ATPase [Brevundimonas fluminis]